MSTRGRNLSIRKSTQTNPTSIQTQVRGSLYDVQSQARRTNQVKGGFSNRLPSGLKEGDVLARFGDDGAIQLGVSDARGDLRTINIPPTFAELPAGIDQYLDLQTGVVPPVLANVPNDGDWGQYYDTATSALYWIRNIGGSLVFLNFLGISGTITDTQHGDRSTTATTMHAFNQISGTITNAQHGNRGGGALHDAATGATAGFMPSADKTKLDAATVSATASTLALRDGGGGTSFAGTLNVAIISGTGAWSTSSTISATGAINSVAQYNVNSTKVVGARQTGWAAPTGTSTRTTFDTATVTTAQLAERVKALLEDLGSVGGHGLISTV